MTETVIRGSVLYSHTSGHPIWTWMDNFLRRCMDIFLSLMGLIFLSPFFLFIAFLIKKDSPGPVFYRGPRVGKNGKIFKILKFRTMYEDPQSYAGLPVTARGDRRVTPFGRWLRDTKINELPQLWNVLVGDMSLVGPRPEDPELVKSWDPEVREQLLSVRPGVTSPASVLYRDEESLLQSGSVLEIYFQDILPSKLRLDQLYLRYRTVFTDLDVIFWTLVALLPRLRAVKIPTHLLYWGPISRLFSRVLNWSAIDFLVSLVSIWVVGVGWRLLGGPLNLGWGNALILSFAMALCFTLVNSLFGLTQVSWSKAPPSAVFELLASAGISLVILASLSMIGGINTNFPLGLLFVSGGLAWSGFTAVRYRERLITGFASRWMRLTKPRVLGERVLIVGAGELGEMAKWFFERGELQRAYQVVGFVDDDPRKVEMSVQGKTVLATTESIPELVQRLDIGLIIFAIQQILPEQRQRILNICRKTTARLLIFPDLMSAVWDFIRRENTPVGWTKKFVQTDMLSIHKKITEIDSLLERGNVAEARNQLAQLQRNIAEEEHGTEPL
ncbi:sugar transferase [Anaerolinea sp.]|uniref:sugar transferase n=1 Tax=Anaerolinea sp. TaxID=1872519 RepID=UPI002ACEC659|nr:sugar transferase [Anaerolinea sp.]